jgi:hypothetical protein
MIAGAALRENRCGRVPVDDECPDAAKALLRRRLLVVSEERRDYWTVVLTGYSPDFDALELGMAPPEYVAEITKHLNGMTLAFRRRATG